MYSVYAITDTPRLGQRTTKVADTPSYDEPIAHAVAQGYTIFTGLVTRVVQADGRTIAEYGPMTCQDGSRWAKRHEIVAESPVVIGQ